MARLVTLATLQNRVLQRANLEVASNAAIYTSAELLDNINEGLARLYGLIIQQQDQPYYLESVNFNTVPTTDTYAIGPQGSAIVAPDFYKGAGFDIMFGQNIVRTARPFMWSERNRYRYIGGWIYTQPVAYRFLGKASTPGQSAFDSVKFMPQPSGQFSITMWYYPTAPKLSLSTDTFDGINGFEEFAVLDAAIKLLTKQEQFEHAQLLMGMQAAEKDRVLGELQTHDGEAPARVQDVRRYEDDNDGWPG